MNTCKHCGSQWETGDVCPQCGTAPRISLEKNTAPVQSEQPEEQSFPIWAIPVIVIGVLAIMTIGGGILLNDSMDLTDSDPEPYFDTDDRFEEEVVPDKPKDPIVLPKETAAPANPKQDREQNLDYQQKHGIFTGEFYEVGSEVPPGEYVVMPNSTHAAPHFHVAVYTSESMSDESQLYGGWYSTCKYVVLEEGQYIELTHAALYDPDKNDLALDPFSADGMYKVGRDIEPGTYTIRNTSDQYTGNFIIYSSINSIAPVTRDFEFLDTGESIEVTLNEGEYIELVFCCLDQ